VIEAAIATSAASPIEPPLALAPGVAGWRRWIGPFISMAVLVAALSQLRGLPVHNVIALVPHALSFWLLFAAFYLAGPASEWVIYRRLWRLPPSGFLALMRKRISNEILLGYSGELYFYGWARRNAAISAAPFGAIKDVAILSAAVGNMATLLLLALAWPLLGSLHLGMSGRMLTVSIGTVALSSLGTLFFRRSIFSLRRQDLQFIAMLHALRVAATLVLTALLWTWVLPAAPLGWWLVLATLSMLVSRLPFVPNKDIVFAGLVAFLIGHGAETASLLAMMAGLILATNVFLGAALPLAELLGAERRAG